VSQCKGGKGREGAKEEKAPPAMERSKDEETTTYDVDGQATDGREEDLEVVTGKELGVHSCVIGVAS
jgi:hypothetical protein